MSLEKSIAFILMIIAFIYGYGAYTYPLLPFEESMAFLPNSLPKILSGLSILCAFFILVAPKVADEEEGDETLKLSAWREYDTAKAVFLILAMVAYALALRPLGFIFATCFFLVGSQWLLGERKIVKMVLISTTITVIIWYLVQEVLGIFLEPLPWFLG